MNRRELLGTASGAVFGITLAGCLSGGGNGGGEDRTPTATPITSDEPTPTTSDEPPTTTDGGFEWPADPTVFDTLTVGDRATVDFPENNRPVEVSLWNALNEARTLSLVVTTPTDAPGLRRDVTFPADGVLVLSLAEPAQYTVSVRTVGDLTVPFERFDCNRTNYNVRLEADGLAHEYVSTEIACPDPELGGVSVSSGEGDCGSVDRATVAFDERAVRVDGAMRTPDPCHDVTVRAADYDRSTDTLGLVLEAVSEGGGCVDCVGEVPYEASAAFANDYPREVVVRHASMQGVREVVRVSRGGGE